MKLPLVGHTVVRYPTLIACVLLALALPVAAAGAADSSASGIRVFTGDNPNFLRFHAANCALKGHSFNAVGYDRGWRLSVQIHPFKGFRSYHLIRGRYNGTFMSLIAPHSGVEYASDFVPPYHIPSGGQINFADHGKLMGGGFYPMFNEDGSDALGVAGVLNCHYPTRKHRH